MFEPGKYGRWNEGGCQCCDEMMTPENVECDDAGDPVGQEFRGVVLVAEVFFWRGHGMGGLGIGIGGLGLAI